MADTNRVITQAQYDLLRSALDNDDRGGFYVALYQYTGSDNALTMAQIAKSSEWVGSVAWGVNNQLKTMFPDKYPAGGVERFSKEIAKNDFSLIQRDASGQYVVPSEYEMLKGARAVWDSHQLGAWWRGMVDAARELGAQSKVPSFWIYTETDTVFPPDVSRAFFDAYKGAGATATLRMFAEGGHGFSRSARGGFTWGPEVDRFPAELGLPSARVAP